MRHFKIGLLGQILLAILLGITAGTFFPHVLVRFFATFSGLFSQFLGFIIPLIILGLVAPAIADIGKEAGKMLFITALLAYTSTVLAGLLSYGVGELSFPSLISGHVNLTPIDHSKGATPFFQVNIPASMDVMTALVLAFMLGLGMAHLQSNALKQTFIDFREIVTKTIQRVILPLLPLYIYGIFLNMTHSGEVFRILSVFGKIIGIIFILHIGWLIMLYLVAGSIVKKSPFKMLRNMLPAYATALGTQSSAATIPVTLRQTIKNGVNKDIAGFVVPLCATIHLSGSMLKIVTCALALMMMQGIGYDFGSIFGFICMLGITMVAAPGVPGGAIMAALGILVSMLEFTEQDQALMIALYIAMDSFGTACNVTGDGALALMIDKWFVQSALSDTRKNN